MRPILEQDQSLPSIRQLDFPVELSAPDITSYRFGNREVDYVHSFSSERAGPHVMVSALVHGNEICGAVALDRLLSDQVRPRKGTLTFAFVNVEAYFRFDPGNPSASRFVEEDLNRLWSQEVLECERDSLELRRARALRPLLDQVDFLLDIHSMQHKTTPLMMAGPLAKGRRLAAAVGVPPLVVTDAGHAAGLRMRDYGAFSDPKSRRNALLVECGQHWERTSATVALDVIGRFLCRTRTLTRDDVEAYLSPKEPKPQRFIEVTGPVTIESDDFHFIEDFQGLEIIPEAGSVIAYDDGKPVRTPYPDCVLVMPSRRLAKGATAVRLGRYLESAPADAVTRRELRA